MFKINFKPENYQKIDNTLSRSAQITKSNIRWLRDKGVTDIINFRTMTVPDMTFDEKAYVESKGIKYHSIPSVSMYPKKENVGKFLDIIEGVKNKNGKLHIHCKQGADRTGMYSYIYERLNNIGTPSENKEEMIKHLWDRKKYPNMIEWAELFIDIFKKKRL